MNVQGESSVNGVACTEIEILPDGSEQERTACLAEDYPFAISLALAQGGQTVLSMTLTDATRP